MSKERIINEEIKLNVEDLVDILKNYKTDMWSPDGFIDSRIHTVVQTAIESAIHGIADDLEYKYKIGNYDGRHDDTD